MRHLTKTGTVDQYHKNGEIEQGYSNVLKGKQGISNGSGSGSETKETV
jgi:hypothetical protein